MKLPVAFNTSKPKLTRSETNVANDKALHLIALKTSIHFYSEALPALLSIASVHIANAQ